ncbi:hypothetical protein ACTHQ4_12775 [Alkalicoccobacillus gibsonii]|uniref:hypothetical protein n=1 Tax=Alkalicoccobacillus gibsonii TaxID=79881 RepID=UPI003F7C8325
MRVEIFTEWNELEPYIGLLQTKEVAHNLAIGLIKKNQESHEQDPLLFSAVFTKEMSQSYLCYKALKSRQFSQF